MSDDIVGKNLLEQRREQLEYSIDGIKHYAVKGKYHVALQEIAESCYQRQLRFMFHLFLFHLFTFLLKLLFDVSETRASCFEEIFEHAQTAGLNEHRAVGAEVHAHTVWFSERPVVASGVCRVSL